MLLFCISSSIFASSYSATFLQSKLSKAILNASLLFSIVSHDNALAEKLRTFSDVDAVAFEGLVQMELNNLYQNNGGDLTLRRVLDLAYSVDCCHVVPGITDDAALGQFYVENDFLPDLATVPDSVLEMLD